MPVLCRPKYKSTCSIVQALALTLFALMIVAPQSLAHAVSPLAERDSASHRAVHALFELTAPARGPFPSDRFTVIDRSHNTRRRVNLPKPDCTERLSDCEDIDVINTLDGFNLQPRLSIPFDGPVDVTTVTSRTVFLVSLNSTLPGGDRGGRVIGINQVVWNPETNTLHVESDEQLDQHTRYALIVTRGVRDQSGAPIETTKVFKQFRHDLRGELREYRRALIDALRAARSIGVRERDIVTASVFTTQSITAVLEKIRDQIKAATPAPADFNIGPDGTRAVFSLDAVTGITWNAQIGDNPPTFNSVQLNLSQLRIIPGAASQIAFGKFLSPDYETSQRIIPPVGTRTGSPAVQGVNEIFFNLVLPSGPMPAGGWPVAIAGHGNPANKNQFMQQVAASLASQGIAGLWINSVGNGFGSLGTLTINRSIGGPVTFSAGGRGFDLNGDNIIGDTEGYNAPAPYTIIRNRDAQRQTAADFMQLVRVIEVGIDADGDGSRDLDPSRIYYVGHSAGGFRGAAFLAVDPSVRAGVLTSTGGGPDWLRLSPPSPPGNRVIIASQLAARIPSLINPPGLTSIGGIPVDPPHFNENLPLRNQPPVINDVPGAIEIQQWFENREWVIQPGEPMAYAPHLRRSPLPGVPAKPVIIQFAKGDQTIPNPAAVALLRAGDLADRATFYRHDLAFAENPGLPKDPHTFMRAPNQFGAIALGAQQQIAIFFASDGTRIIHPEPTRFFEVPISSPLPEADLNYIP